MTMRRVLFMIPIFALFTPLSLIAQPPDLEVPRLAPDEAMTGTIDGDLSAQLYILHAQVGDILTIEMSANENDLDPFLILLDMRGGVVAANDDRHADTLDAALVDVEVSTTGAYLLLATTFENLDEFLSLAPPEPLTYTLSASGFTGDTERQPQLETTALTLGDPVEIDSSPTRPVAYLTFDANQGELLDIVARRVAAIDPILHIFGPDGARVGFDDDDDTSRTFTVDAAVYGLEIPTDGRYLVVATDTFFYNALDPNASLRYSPGTLTVEVRQTPVPLLPGS